MTEWIVTNCESVGNTHDICQDHTEYMVSNNVYVGALADGVSSNIYSDEGAKAVTEFACQEMCLNFTKYYKGELSSRDFVQTLQTKMNLKYANMKDLNQMKSTLLLCAIYKNQYMIGHIGDGAILCFGRESFVISPPQENEVGGTATYTILDYNAEDHFQFKMGTVDDLDGFLITSDGLLGNVYYSGIDVPQLAYELFGSVYKKTSPAQKADRDALFKAYFAEHIQRGNALADDCSIFMIARKNRTGYVDYDQLNGFEADVKWPCKCGNQNRMDEIRCSNCRTMYTLMYPGNIVKIHSKEGFFSKLHKWMLNDAEKIFDPGITADVVDTDGFVSMCNSLKNAMDPHSFVEENVSHLQHTEDSSNNESNQPKSAPVKKGGSIHEKSVVNAENAFEKVAKLGIGALKKGLQLLTENDTTSSKQQSAKQKKKTDSDNIQEVFPVVLSYEQMIEAGYRLNALPMTFVDSGESTEINEEQINVVKAMFYHDAFFDLFQHDEEIEIIHCYLADNGIIAVYDGRTPEFCCRIFKSAKEILNNMWLIPRQCFYKELQKCNKINTSSVPFENIMVAWNWPATYTRYRADAEEMVRIFRSMFNKCGYSFEDIIANIWFVAGNNDSIELVAYLLTNQYLLRVKSVNQKCVVVNQVSLDDNCAFLLRDKYLV